MLRLQRYNLHVEYRKGSSLVLADTLSRAPLSSSHTASPSNFEVFRLSVQQVDQQPNLHLTLTTTRAMQHATASDPDMQQLVQIISCGWPASKSALPAILAPYWSIHDELSITEGIIYRGHQTLVPHALSSTMLQKIHASHMGAASNSRMCRDILYWPGKCDQRFKTVMCATCSKCSEHGTQHAKEPMQSAPVPEYPWQLVSQDLFQFNCQNYLITVDHFSDFFEVDLLPDTLATTVVHKSKAQFARHGLPEVLLSDNGPQFISSSFSSFCQMFAALITRHLHPTGRKAMAKLNPP